MAKKSRRARKQDKKKGRLAPGVLVAQARQHLAGGRAREALDLLREVQHKDGRQGELPALLFCAYVKRAQQLVQKGLHREAEVMQSRADACRAQVDFQVLSPEDFVRLIDALPVADAVEAYARALPVRGDMPHVVRRLTDRAVTEQALDALHALPEDHDIRRDAPVVAAGVAAMDKGEWAQAAERLAGISRRSPFAPWRAFCRGMACFCAGDDAGAQRAAGLIPGDFVLAEVAAGWRSTPDVPEAVRSLLWEGSADAGDLARAFVAAVGKGRMRELERLIPRLAQALYPEDPKAMGASLIGVLGIAVAKGQVQHEGLTRLGQQLLGPDWGALSAGKAGLVAQAVARSRYHAGPALTYLSQMAVEFPDEARQALARGLVLEHLAKLAHKSGPIAFVSPFHMPELTTLIGHPVEDVAAMDVALMLASLEADPDNREGYAFLLTMLPNRRSARQKAERALEEMARRFPEDPAPCLELADLHYAKNAYRKAEGALSEAVRRAPHDERVLDRLAIGHLKAAEQNRNRGRWPLAERDFEAAETLGRRRVAGVLQVKRWGMAVMHRGLEALREIEQALSEQAPAAHLRLLVLLVHDLDLFGKQPEAQEKLMERLYAQDGLIASLTSAEAAALLAPIDAMFELVFEDLDVAPFLEDFWPGLLAHTDGEDTFAACDALLACDAHETVRREIDRRLKSADGENRDVLPLLFYLAAIRHMEGLDVDSRRFVDVIDRADAAQRRRLQAAALRLSAFADGALQEALKQFDFDVLDEEFLPPGSTMGLPFEDDDWEDDDWDDDDDDDDDDGVAFDNPIQMVESLIDVQGLRGAPLPMLQEGVGVLRSNAESRQLLDEMARLLEPLAHMLSREAHLLLYPKRRRRR